MLVSFCAVAVAVAAVSGCEQAPNGNDGAAPGATTGANAAQPVNTVVSGPSQGGGAAGAGNAGATVCAYKLARNGAEGDANGLVAVPIKMSPGEKDAARVALESLVEGSNSPLPAGTTVRRVVIDAASKTALVDFSPELRSNFKGGETEEAQVINSVLKTLGQFDTIERVQFLVDGKRIDTLGGAQDLSQPLPTPQAAAASASGSGGGAAAGFGGNGANK